MRMMHYIRIADIEVMIDIVTEVFGTHYKIFFKPVQQEAVCLYSSRWMLVLDIPSTLEDMQGGVSIPY